MANEEKELYKFVNDPKYRSKVIAKIHKNSDNAYNKRIKKIEHERDALSKKRTREITRIARQMGKPGWRINWGQSDRRKNTDQ